MSNQIPNPNDKKKYDLKERTAKFGEKIIKFCQNLPPNAINAPLICQLVRAGTSIGANYMEADGAESKKDFRHKIGICKKESRETKHWVRILSIAVPELRDKIQILWEEARQLNLIFNSINNKLK